MRVKAVEITARQISCVVDTEPPQGEGANSTRGQARRKTEFFRHTSIKKQHN